MGRLEVTTGLVDFEGDGSLKSGADLFDADPHKLLFAELSYRTAPKKNLGKSGQPSLKVLICRQGYPPQAGGFYKYKHENSTIQPPACFWLPRFNQVYCNPLRSPRAARGCPFGRGGGIYFRSLSRPFQVNDNAPQPLVLPLTSSIWRQYWCFYRKKVSISVFLRKKIGKIKQRSVIFREKLFWNNNIFVTSNLS